MDRLVTHVQLETFHLCWRVNGSALSKESVVVEDANHRSVLSSDHTTGCANKDVVNPMVVNALHVNFA